MRKTNSFSQNLLDSSFIATASFTHAIICQNKVKSSSLSNLICCSWVRAESSGKPQNWALYKTLEGNSAKSHSFSGWVKSGKIPFLSDVSRSLQIYICKRPTLIHVAKWCYIHRSRIRFWILEGFLSLKIWRPETNYFRTCIHIDVLHFFFFIWCNFATFCLLYNWNRIT